MTSNNVQSIAFALDPGNVPVFLLDWELTKLCNLDCSYCSTGLEGGHDNTTQHPPVAECLQAIDFMYEYVNEYMQHKRPTQRKVILNVYGGESVFHPDIVEILEACKSKYEPYQNDWHLTVTVTTNGISGKNQWARIVPLVDEFTVSYHSETLPKQKQQYLDNILYLKEHNKRVKCIIMMHPDEHLFDDSNGVVEFCKTNSIDYVIKPVDSRNPVWIYSKDQFQQLKNFWVGQVAPTKQADYAQSIEHVGQSDQVQSIYQGRACCGGRKLSVNGDLKSSVSFVPRQGFEGWSCSVNWFFLFVRQVDGAVFTNKDCQTSTTGRVEPLGYLKTSNQIIDTLKKQFETQTMPIIKCVKEWCRCGFCAPKAESVEEFSKLIKRHVITDIFQS